MVVRATSKAEKLTHPEGSAFLPKMLLRLQLLGAVRPPDHYVLGAGASMSAKSAEALTETSEQPRSPNCSRYRSQADAMDDAPSTGGCSRT